MRILVCGGRDYGHVVRTTGDPAMEPPETQVKLAEYKKIHHVLHDLVMEHSKLRNDHDNWLPTDITIISGAAKGADSAAADFAIVQYCNLEEYPADWEKNGRAAGYIRNRQMLVEGKPDLVIAFPGGKGTAMMVDIARLAGVKVIEVK